MLATASTLTTAATDWRAAMRAAIRTTAELLELLELTPEQISAHDPRDDEFPLLVPRSFAARMRKGDPHDPLLRQVVPLTVEGAATPGFTNDPLGERELALGGIVRKYAGRALLIATAACPVHCRYCFRRHFPYAEQTAARNEWNGTAAALAAAGDVHEVILSGGDPLSRSNRSLRSLVTKLESIEHISTLRIHTRFPIVLPERVETGLLELLAATRLKTVVVVHCNHPQEIDSSVEAAVAGLRRAGAIVLNQSVLLHGINDSADTLVELSWRLLAAGVLPYYLHELDRVAGTAHFEVEATRARDIVDALRARLPGYLVPRLVREIPGELSKTVLA